MRREIIKDRRIAIAAPIGEGVRRIDTLAFLRWTLPSLIDVFPEFPQRLLIVSAGSPMWRGGLSGPSSLFLHADRPLISENGTQHHAARTGTRGHRWAVQGPPPTGLSRGWQSTTLSRYCGAAAVSASAGFARRSRCCEPGPTPRTDNCATRRREADTARAVLVLYALTNELNAGGISMDSVVARLPASGPLGLAQLRMIVAAELGAPSKVLTPIRGVEEIR